MNRASSYVLESESEFDRLERQAQTPAYDYRDELTDITRSGRFDTDANILDAGCGSGVVTRYLAQSYPEAAVHGCDFSALRVEQAKRAAEGLANLHLRHAGLDSLPYPANHFDLIVCRFVLQHLRPKVRDQVLREFLRCLKPGGTVRIIETDGLFFNLSPISARLARQLELWKKDKTVDMYASRKLPRLLLQTGFASVDWDIQAISFRGEHLKTETEIYVSRFEQAIPLFGRVLGSKAAAKKFAEEYVETMKKPGAVVFHNKFLITAKKASIPSSKVTLLRPGT